CDIVAPSDMMDGRVSAIREFLDNCGFSDVCILSYAAKFCSCLYKPFREVVGSRTMSQSIDKSTYQLDVANTRESLLEAQMDIEEGADIIMVKPGTFYLDVISAVSAKFNVPVFAYQVGGEYAMIKAASMNGWIDYDKCMYESLISIKRAGARCIVTYAALEMAQKLGAGTGII
ncbi:MAG: porphobilinogen synthase, partial [Anaplasma sp.]